MEGETIAFLLWCFLAVIIIIGVWWVLTTMLDMAYGQKAPPAEVPTPSPTPIQIQPNPNFEYLPQKAYVQTYKPEIGIPVGQQGLTAVPQVQVQPAVQSNTIAGFDMTEIFGIIGTLVGAGAYLKGHLVGKKTDKVEETTKEQSVQIVKGADVDATIAKQVFENMTDKGLSINDKPEIKLENLNKNKEEATETAAKA